LERLVRVIPRCVVRGVQLGLALSLARLALGQYVPAMGPPGYALALVSFVLLALLFGNRRIPAALPVIGLGVVVAFVSGGASGITAKPGIHLPVPQVPAWTDITTGFVLLALPQLPLSLSNSIIATHRALRDLFPQHQVGVRKLGFSYGLANVIIP